MDVPEAYVAYCGFYNLGFWLFELVNLKGTFFVMYITAIAISYRFRFMD